MDKILIVDDFKDYCEELACALDREGFNVETAHTAREAITLGSKFRPELLITDWMLQDYIHGLEVAEALAIVCSSMKTILITGLASADLKADARYSHVFAFLEKPFPLHALIEQAHKASIAEKTSSKSTGIGFMEVDSEGRVLHLNEDAQLMIETIHPHRIATFLSDIFSDQALDRLKEAEEDWTDLSPADDKTTLWTIRSSELRENERQVFVLLDEEHKIYSSTSVVHRLLGLPDPITPKLAISGHLLVIDDQDSLRRISADVLRDFRCICHTARNHEEAIRLFVHDPEIKYVILDYEMPEAHPGDFVRIAKDLRPETYIIGTSAADHRTDFSDLGIDVFLPKPWVVEELISAIKDPQHRLGPMTARVSNSY